jgi:uncharacterized protein (TIGR02452 family)
MKREQRLAVAQETVEIVQQGRYEVAGQRVEIAPAIRHCLDRTRMFSAGQLAAIRDSLLGESFERRDTQFEVANETTLQGLARLTPVASGPIGVLNFASARNPGGGFLKGSEAQEESLARSSALYASLTRAGSFYEKHRALSSALYTDAMILSPGCPVIREDAGGLLPKPRLASFITSPAPNAGAALQNHPAEVPQIGDVLVRRSELVLALAASQGYVDLILGAWGCGVFRNDPRVVAAAFATHLRGAWAGRFQRVLFSVYDASETKGTLRAFEEQFA